MNLSSTPSQPILGTLILIYSPACAAIGVIAARLLGFRVPKAAWALLVVLYLPWAYCWWLTFKAVRPRDEKLLAAYSQLTEYWQALQVHYSVEGKYPGTKEGLGSVGRVKSGEIKLQKDPWGHDYVYECQDGASFRLYSPGPDGTPGTSDDIRGDSSDYPRRSY